MSPPKCDIMYTGIDEESRLLLLLTWFPPILFWGSQGLGCPF